MEDVVAMGLEYAHEGADDLVEALQCWGFDAIVVCQEDSWMLFVEGAFVTAATAENPVTAMDRLYNRVIELFVTRIPQA